jgi:hypothetical protein
MKEISMTKFNNMTLRYVGASKAIRLSLRANVRTVCSPTNRQGRHSSGFEVISWYEVEAKSQNDIDTDTTLATAEE